MTEVQDIPEMTEVQDIPEMIKDQNDFLHNVPIVGMILNFHSNQNLTDLSIVASVLGKQNSMKILTMIGQEKIVNQNQKKVSKTNQRKSNL